MSCNSHLHAVMALTPLDGTQAASAAASNQNPLQRLLPPRHCPSPHPLDCSQQQPASQSASACATLHPSKTLEAFQGAISNFHSKIVQGFKRYRAGGVCRDFSLKKPFMSPVVHVSPEVARVCQAISQLYKPAQMMKIMIWKPEFMERKSVGDSGRSWRRNFNPFGDA